ncbi:hypothetical protein ES703_03928 [subsurface metagenome]
MPASRAEQSPQNDAWKSVLAFLEIAMSIAAIVRAINTLKQLEERRS